MHPTRAVPRFTWKAAKCRRPIRTSWRVSSAKMCRCGLPITKSPACSSVFSGGNDMALLSFLFNPKPKTASAAKERLQVIIARERNGRDGPDFLPALHKELIAVISKYAKVNPEDIKISLDRQ